MNRSGQPDSSLWLQSWTSRLTPLVDLICVPGAGAGASSYRPWQRNLPGYIALHVCQLPGRENRIDEPGVSDLQHVVGQISLAYLNGRSAVRPLILFGHSMGGVIAFELAQKLQAQGAAPTAIVLSASTPPRSQPQSKSKSKSKSGETTSTLSDEALKQLLLTYDADNQPVVENEELFASLAPVLQSDFQLLRSHEIVEECTLSDVDAHLMSGDSDLVVSRKSVARWEPFFDGSISHHSCSGGHQFPFRESEAEVVALLSQLAHRTLAKVET